MQKLKAHVYEKMLYAGLTSAEVDFMIYLSQHQDDTGRIYGVYYRDVCKAIDTSADTFYAMLKSLPLKGLITVEKCFYGDWDITIKDNDFSGPKSEWGNYISTGDDIYYSKEFKALKGNEKLLAMQFLKIGKAGKHYRIGVDKLYDKYTRLLRVSGRTLQVYLGSLKKFFSIGISKGIYWITPLVKVFKRTAPKDREKLSGHLGKVGFRRNRIAYTKELFQDAANLAGQYSERLKEHERAQVFLEAVAESIKKKNQKKKCKYKWDRTLNLAFVHKLMRQQIDKMDTNRAVTE